MSDKIKRGEAELGGWYNSSKVGYYTKYSFPYKQFAQEKEKKKRITRPESNFYLR